MKLFDLHCHTSGISRCCRLPAETIVATAKETGYDGIVLTNHYTKGYLGERTYADWVESYIAEYENTKELGRQVGLEVLFGVEVTYEIQPSIHILLYGATPDFLRENGELYALDSHSLYELCHANGICVIHAHPYRNGTMPLPYEDCDGYEINCHPIYDSTHSQDICAMQEQRGFLVTCGCDYHGDSYRATAGTFLPDDTTNELQLAQNLLSCKTITIRVQEIGETHTRDLSFSIRR